MYNINTENIENIKNNIQNSGNKFNSNNNTDILNDSLYNKKYELKDLSNLNLNDIMQYYKNEDNSEDETDLADIYYYLFYYNKNNKIKGQYSEDFLEKHKDHN